MALLERNEAEALGASGKATERSLVEEGSVESTRAWQADAQKMTDAAKKSCRSSREKETDTVKEDNLTSLLVVSHLPRKKRLRALLFLNGGAHLLLKGRIQLPPSCMEMKSIACRQLTLPPRHCEQNSLLKRLTMLFPRSDN
jgi:hypothetical protein